MRYVSEPGDTLDQIALKQGRNGEGSVALEANRDLLLNALLMRTPLPTGTVLDLPNEWDPNYQPKAKQTPPQQPPQPTNPPPTPPQ